MRALLSPTELQQLFGSTNVKEELLGDILEFALGILTIATRYPQHFVNWGGPETTNACVRGIERSFWVYANIENIKLVTRPQLQGIAILPNGKPRFMRTSRR